MYLLNDSITNKYILFLCVLIFLNIINVYKKLNIGLPKYGIVFNSLTLIRINSSY